MNHASTATLGGVVPPVCTPLTPDRELDERSLERLVAFLLDAGVHGLFVAGSTGETAYLPDDVRLRVLDVVRGTAAAQVPVLMGVVDTSTPRVIRQARAAAEHGADALVATAPFYTPTHPVEIETHFRAVRAAVDLPLLGYDIPRMVGTKLGTDTVVSLASDATLTGIKDSSGDVDAMRSLLNTLDVPGFRVFTGSETLADLGLRLGAHGIVPGLGNVDPHGYVRLFEAAGTGDWAAAEAEQLRLGRLFRLVDVGDSRRMGGYSSAIGAFKAALAARGVIEHATTSLPMVALDDHEEAGVVEQLDDAGLLGAPTALS